MGYAADDAWNDAFQDETNARIIAAGLQDFNGDLCSRPDCAADSFVMTDDGLYQCPLCDRIVDL